MRALALIVVCASAAVAQQSDSTRSLSSLVFADAGKTLGGTGYYITSPLRFDGAEWLATCGVLAGTGILMTQDRAIHDALHSGGRESYNGDFWDGPTALGDFVGAGSVAAVLYGIG